MLLNLETRDNPAFKKFLENLLFTPLCGEIYNFYSSLISLFLLNTS